MPVRLWTKLAIGLAGLGLVVSFLFGLSVGRGHRQTTDLGVDLVREAETAVRESAGGKIEEKRLVQGAIRGMLEALGDPYAEFLDPDAYRSFRDLSAGHFAGVGMWLEAEDNRLRIVSVREGTPAARAGIRNGDILTSIDGRPTQGLPVEHVVGQIKGRRGTSVALSIGRGDRSLSYNLVREDIDVPVVSSRLLENRLGLIELVTFPGGAGAKVRRAVSSLAAQGARGFILDLRGNPGGLLDEAVNVASVFVEGGPVVSFGRPGQGDVVYKARAAAETKLPLVVLVDQGSASASEVVAGAIKDRGRGVLVGAHTYGKGSIQSVVPLSDGSAIKVTTSTYRTPSGRSIGRRGIEPDVVVEDRGAQLPQAQQILQEMLTDTPARRAG